MIHDLKGLIHTVAALLAVLIGSVIFLRPKGGGWHRFLGYVYSLCMLTVIVTAFAIYRLTGHFNFLHGFAVMAGLGVGMGFAHAFLRKPRESWYTWHYYWMSWSYIGLLAAFVAELSTRVALPYISAKFGSDYLIGFWSVVGLATFVVVMVGRYFVEKNSPKKKGRPALAGD